MQTRFPIFYAIRQELYDWRLWMGRAVVLAFAALTGLIVVGFTWLTEQAFAQFVWLKSSFWWSPLLWTPISTVAIVWLMRRHAPRSTLATRAFTGVGAGPDDGRRRGWHCSGL